jgi:hypothetical protein
MALERKEFFRRRSAAQIRRLDVDSTGNPHGLVNRLIKLEPDTDAVALYVRLTPGRFFRGDVSGRRASRLYWKHGGIVPLDLPLSIRASHESPQTMQGALAASLDDKIGGLREETIDHVGFGWSPIHALDKTRRIVPLIWNLEAMRLLAYVRQPGERPAEDMIRILHRFDASASVDINGANVGVYVPSRSQGHPGYEITIPHVPVRTASNGRATPLSIVSGISQMYNRPPTHMRFNIRFPFRDSRERQDVHVLYPHALAALYEVAEKYAREKNGVPLQNLSMLVPSEKLARLYMAARNNVVIYDSTLEEKSKLRRLHIDEISALLMRGIGVLGAEGAMWKKGRDAKISTYRWALPPPA